MNFFYDLKIGLINLVRHAEMKFLYVYTNTNTRNKVYKFFLYHNKPIIYIDILN